MPFEFRGSRALGQIEAVFRCGVRRKLFPVKPELIFELMCLQINFTLLS